MQSKLAMGAVVISAFLNDLLPDHWQVLLLSRPSIHLRCSIAEIFFTSAVAGGEPVNVNVISSVK